MQEFIQSIKNAIRIIGEYTIFTFQTFVSMFRHPPSYRDVVEQMDALGVQSLLILIATGMFSGMAITMLLEAELGLFGSKVYTGRVLGIVIIRELGPVITGLMLSGRLGARIASELGSMRVTQQIDSIEGLGQDPIQKIVTPRVLALMLIAPACTMVTNLMGMLGGFLVATVSPGSFWFEARKAFVMRHLSGGMIKPFVFGFIIASIASYVGLHAGKGVRGVGQAAANAVVAGSVIIFLANYFIGFIVLDLFGV